MGLLIIEIIDLCDSVILLGYFKIILQIFMFMKKITGKFKLLFIFHLCSCYSICLCDKVKNLLARRRLKVQFFFFFLFNLLLFLLYSMNILLSTSTLLFKHLSTRLMLTKQRVGLIHYKHILK